MKKFFSKFIITVLCILCFSYSALALDTDNDITKDFTAISETYFIVKGNDGIWRPSITQNETVIQEKSNNDALKVTFAKDYENIYQTSDNMYFFKVDNNSYVPVEKLTATLSDSNGIESLQQYKIPNEIYQDILKMKAIAEENGYADTAEVTLFVTKLSNGAKSDYLNIMPNEVTYWQNKKFISRQIYFTNMWTSWKEIAKGSGTTEATLKSIKELSMFATNYTPIGTAMDLINTGKNILENWKSTFGYTPIYGNTQNKVMVDVCYNICLKYTYYYEPMKKEEYLGCSSQKARILQIDTDTYLVTSQGGKRTEDTVYPNKVYYTPNFLNPEPKAFEFHISGWVERVKGKVYNAPIIFTWPDFDWPPEWP